MPPDHPLAPFLPFLPLLILIPILYFRLRKLSRPQPLKLTRLWIRPAVLVLVGALVIWAPQPGMTRHFTLSEWLLLALAGVIGAVAGGMLGAAAEGGPGPLVEHFSGAVAGTLPCPLVIVPERLGDDALDR